MDRTRLPDGDEPDTEGERDARSEDEPRASTAATFVDPLIPERIGKSLDGSGKKLSVGEKPGDVGVAVDPAKAPGSRP